MKVDDLMKIYFSIGVMSSKVIPNKYVVPLDEFERDRDRVDSTQSTNSNVHAEKEKANG